MIDEKNKYDFDYDWPLEISISYRKDDLDITIEWLKLPVKFDDLKELYNNMGVDLATTQILLNGVNCFIEGMDYNFNPYEDLDELNYLAAKIELLDDEALSKFKLIMACEVHNSVKEAINFAANIDSFVIEKASETKPYLELLGYDILTLPQKLQEHGFIALNGLEYEEVYDGNPQNIPAEYCITNDVRQRDGKGESCKLQNIEKDNKTSGFER